MTRPEPVTAKTGRDLGLGEDWADIPIHDWTDEEEEALRQVEMEGRWEAPLMIKPPKGWSDAMRLIKSWLKRLAAGRF